MVIDSNSALTNFTENLLCISFGAERVSVFYFTGSSHKSFEVIGFSLLIDGVLESRKLRSCHWQVIGP